jgi:hypothetical protein
LVKYPQLNRIVKGGENMPAITAETKPALFKMATEGAMPENWLKDFNEKEYGTLVQMHGEGAPLIPWVEGLASGLDGRGARELAKKVRAGGMLTQRALWQTEGEDAKLTRFIRVQNYLEFINREISEGLKEEKSSTGESARVLGMVLQNLAADFLKRKASKNRARGK